jgi:predicted HTH transcriptional regulator
MLSFRANLQHLLANCGERGLKRLLGEQVGEKVRKALTSIQRKILTLLRANPRMAAREVAQRIGIANLKVEQNIAELKALTLLKCIGPAKGAIDR